MKPKHILPGVLLVMVLAVAFQNYSIDSVRFFFWTFHTSKAVVVFMSMIFGVIIGYVSAKN